MRPLNQDFEQSSPESPQIGDPVENAADEANILADQDETRLADPAANDANLGSDGTAEDFGLDDRGEFARGEIDLKEQMDRTMANMNASHRRSRDPNTTPYSDEGKVGVTKTHH